MPASQPALGPIEPSREAVDVWQVGLAAADLSGGLLEALADDERERASQFQSETARRRFVVTRAALRSILGRYLSCPPFEIRIEQGASGKPRLTAGCHSAGELQFNVTHSGELALVAMTLGCEVGIDVEQLRTVGHFEQIADRYFHPKEVAALAAMPATDRAAAFLRCWTCKEAVLKAVGEGVTGPLDGFHVPFDHTGGSNVDMVGAGKVTCWLQPLALESGYVGAVANLGERRRVRWNAFPIQFADATSRE